MTDTPLKQASITSPDIQQERLNELKRLFPDLFDGEGQLDEAALKALCNPDGTRTTERFRFEWAGKQESKRLAFKPSRATLIADKDRSIDFDTTQNMIIEGDNLEVLKLLRTTYFEQVKCIYIDPPYNKDADVLYPDNFAEGKKAYWQKNGTIKDGVKLQAVTESSGRKHSNWLNMMQSRLLLAQQLLREDGVIFISIDDNEQANLKKLCDEIFGEDNFIADINVINNLKGRNDKKYIATANERLLMYMKSDAFEEYGLDLPESKIDEYKYEDEDGKYRLIELRKRGGADTRKERPNMFYPIYVDPITGNISLYKSDIFCQKALPVKSNDVEGRWRWGLDTTKNRINLLKGQKVKGSDKYNIYEKNYLESEGVIKRLKPKSVMSGSDYSTDLATKQYRSLLPQAHFDNPKPVPMIRDLITYATSPDSNSICLDFFAGSGTSAHAIMERNAEDKGNRKFICVQIPEYTDEESESFKAGYKTISQICIERVKRAGEKIKSENPDIDTGFRVYKLADSYFPENLFTSDPDKSEAENLEALEAHIKASSQKSIFDNEDLPNIITEISLKNGYGLFFTLETLGDFSKNTMYRLTGNDKSTLLCLDEVIHEVSVDTLTEQYNTEHLIISKHGVDTAKKWTLQNTFKDNMQVV